jgi:hypothetical protein
MQKGHRTSEAVRLNGGDNGHAGLELRARYGARFEERPLACCEIDLRAPCGLDRRRQRGLASRAGLWGTERVGAVVSTCMQGWPPSREQCVPQASRASHHHLHHHHHHHHQNDYHHDYRNHNQHGSRAVRASSASRFSFSLVSTSSCGEW